MKSPEQYVNDLDEQLTFDGQEERRCVAELIRKVIYDAAATCERLAKGYEQDPAQCSANVDKANAAHELAKVFKNWAAKRK